MKTIYQSIYLLIFLALAGMAWGGEITINQLVYTNEKSECILYVVIPMKTDNGHTHITQDTANISTQIVCKEIKKKGE